MSLFRRSRSAISLIEPLECRSLLTGSVTSLVLVNADTRRDIMTLSNGATLNLASLPTKNLNIRANISGAVESVKFALDSNSSYHTESSAPYYFAGDDGKWTPSVGTRTVKATPYSADRAGGSAGVGLTFSLNVISSTSGSTSGSTTTSGTYTGGAITSFSLLNADTGQSLMTIDEGDVIDLSKLPTKRLAVRANTSGKIGSIQFAFDGDIHTESAAPYSLHGDSGGKYTPFTPGSGTHTLSATVYSGSGASGTKGDNDTVKFSVTGGTTSASSLPSSGAIRSLSQTIVNSAIAHPLIRYGRSFPGGAHTNEAHNGESAMVLAAAALAGNTSADKRLLEQIRYVLAPGNEITATGGYPSQHERHITGTFALAKMTPRIWNALSTTERKRIDLIMKAALVASAFTTSDSNPYELKGTKHYALDGNTNLNRDWNPNYREGMIGGVLVGMVYFGGPSSAHGILSGYSHGSFLAELKSYGLNNIYQTFNWKSANPTSGAPTGSMIEAAIESYRYYGSSLHDPMAIYRRLAGNTFGKNVNAGLNYGIGFDNYGKILSGASTLPNKSAAGMLLEFDSFDSRGGRSSAQYAYDSYRTHLTNHVVLVAGGYFNKSSAGDSVSRLKIGSIDLWYKLDKGYANYANGSASGTSRYGDSGKGCHLVRAMWDTVVRPFHGI